MFSVVADQTCRTRRARTKIDSGLVLTVLLALFAVWPLLSPGLPNTADGPIHFYRAVDMQQAWRDGVLYPRWSANLALGYGTPLFNFAPPLISILMMSLNTVGLDLALAMKLVVILFVLVSALGAYLLGRDTLGPQAGLVAAAAYLYAPYRLREMYIQGNYAQFMGIALYPLVLWCYFKVIQSGKLRYIIGGGLAYAALFLSHNISVMIFSPLLAAYVIFWLVLRRKWAAVRDVLITGVLGLGLSAFFWLPAFYEQRWLQISQITKGHFDFRLHFLTLRELFAPYVPLDYSAVNVHLPLSLGLASVVLAVMALIAVVWVRENMRDQRLLIGFSAILLTISVFLMVPPSTFLWEHVPLLKLTEFPWRLLEVAAVPLSLLAGGSVYFFHKLLPKRLSRAVPALSLVCVLIPSFFYLFPRQPFVDLSGAEVKDIMAYELRTKAFGTTSAGEFLPMWTVEHPTDSPMVADYEAGRPVDKLDRTSLPSSARVEETGRGYLWNAFSFESGEPFTVRFNTLWFPGWQVYLDGDPVASSASSPQGLIELDIPAGKHAIKLSFGSTPVRDLANGLSIAALLLCLVLVLLRSRWPRPKPALSSFPAYLRWSFTSMLWGGGTLLALLVAKECVIGPYTDWFRVQSPPGQVIGVEHPAHIALGDHQAVFLGYDLNRDTVAQGDPVTVRVYWQAGPDIKTDYRSFVHLDAPSDWTTVSQSDAMHPGGIPMTTWPPTLYAWDEHHISIPENLTPGLYVLRAGLYDGETGQRLPTLDKQGQASGDNVSLQGLRVTRSHPLQVDQLPERSPIQLGDKIQLVSYALPDEENLARGDAPVVLYWRATAPVEADYTVFVHLLDKTGEIIAQADAPPVGGLYPTTYWLPGEIVEDSHYLPVPDSILESYQVVVGLYDPDTLNRLEAIDTSGNPLPEKQVALE